MEFEKHLKYRADIDGLRAIAVLAVVAFHAFPTWVKGGFVGVDVFFVISGYLISTIIFNNLNNNNFSFYNFYIRRINRIFPALFIVLLVTYVFGWYVLYADEYKQLSKHLVSGAMFVANFTLWGESGYFDNIAETKPLLHLWSLGIEEQFYIFWPLILSGAYFLLKKQKLNSSKNPENYVLYILVSLFILSFSLNVFNINKDLTATFYSPLTRAWELLLGATLAWLVVNKQSNNILNPQASTITNAISIIGLILIVVTILGFDKSSNFPGWIAVLPTIGSLLIIMAGLNTGTWLNKYILSNKILVSIGLISFPLYLWHWPLLVFARIIEGNIPSRTTRIIIVLISIILSWLTYKLIEKPIRFKLSKQSTLVTKLLCVSMLSLSMLGFVTYKYNGFDYRIYSKNQVQSNTLSQYKKNHPTSLVQHDDLYYKNKKFNNFFNSRFIKERDFLIDKPAKNKSFQATSVAIIGDSHANKLFIGTAKYSKFNLINIGRGTCPPFIGVEVYNKKGAGYKCQPLTDNYLKYVKNDNNIKVITINSFYNQYYREGTFLYKNNKKITAQQAIKDTIDFFANTGKKIIIATDVPEIDSHCYSKNNRRPIPVWKNRVDNLDKCNIAIAAQHKIDNIITSLIDTDMKKNSIYVYSPKDILCNNNKCGEIDKQNYLYSNDGNHLNDYGVQIVGRHFANYLDSVLN